MEIILLLMLSIFLNFKGEERKTIPYKIVQKNSQLHAHNDSGFDTWIVLNNLPCDKHIVDIIKNGKGKNSMRVFNGYIQNKKKQVARFLPFRCCMTHLNYSFKKNR